VEELSVECSTPPAIPFPSTSLLQRRPSSVTTTTFFRAIIELVRLLYVPRSDVRTAFFAPVTVKKVMSTLKNSMRVLSSKKNAVSNTSFARSRP
jgi:hypothetical protein